MLLDEAAGVKLNEQPILPPGVQQGTAEVASWNKRKVRFILSFQAKITILSEKICCENARQIPETQAIGRKCSLGLIIVISYSIIEFGRYFLSLFCRSQCVNRSVATSSSMHETSSVHS